MNEDNSQMINSFLKDLNIPKLSEEQKVSCEGKTTLEECALLLESFANNKSPGNDVTDLLFDLNIRVLYYYFRKDRQNKFPICSLGRSQTCYTVPLKIKTKN